MSERPGRLTLEEAVDRVMTRDDVLLGLDFDGTLAPIVAHPDEAVPDGRAMELLRDLAPRPELKVAIVSGRGLDDLRTRLGEVRGAVLVGEHGNDVGGHTAIDPLIAQAHTVVEQIAEPLGATVERKKKSVTFHYRRLSEDDAERALSRIRDWASRYEDIEVMEGKKVIELSTADSNKGDAIRELSGQGGIIYIGDDVTDETVFRVLGPEDVGVKVGEGPTAASHRVKDIAGVVTILERIALASGVNGEDV